jgi:ribosomal protein S12 methylthiotransferase accessory factor
LPEHERAPQFDDYCRHREGCEEEGRTLAWCAAEDLGSGGQLYIPELLISLDYTRGLDSEIQRVSDGLASGGTPAEATLHGLYELIERDAVGEWMRAGFIGRSSTFVDPCWNWLRAWRHRLGALDLEGTLFRVPALAGLPVYLFQVRDRSPRGGAAWGSGCHDLAELAAFKAMAEALQSRLTLIAGARDDIIQEDFAACTGAGLGIRPPGPAAAQAQEDGGLGTGEVAVAELVRRLVALGYRQVGRVDLGRADIGIAVAKMFVPGLGSLSRERRLP